MTALGSYLRAERERCGITLEQLQDGTKIRLKYLKAIEEGQFQEMPGEVYLKGFLRSYAEFVGLDGSEIVKRYQDLKREMAPEADAATSGRQHRQRTARTAGFVRESSSEGSDARRSSSQRDRTAARPRRRVRRSRLVGVAFGGLLVALVGASLIYRAVVGLPGDRRASTTVQTSAEAPVAAHAVEARTGDASHRGAGKSPVSGSAAADISGQEVPGDGVRVITEGRARSWVRVSEDGKATFQGFLAKGQSRVWTAQKAIDITFTNAGGVTVTHNGTPLGVVGEVGRVVTRTFGPGVRHRAPATSGEGTAARSGLRHRTNASLGERSSPRSGGAAPVAASLPTVTSAIQASGTSPKSQQQARSASPKPTSQITVVEAPSVTAQEVLPSEQGVDPAVPGTSAEAAAESNAGWDSDSTAGDAQGPVQPGATVE